MALQVPDDFDVHTEKLDVNETFVRDTLNLQIENWARFRYTIHVGNAASNLHSINPISDEVKAAYRELAKSHYEVVTSLGCAAVSLEMVAQSLGIHPILFKKSVKDFYFHTGCLLDNLARLIYIINDPNSTTKTNRGRLVRHWVDWGSLRDYAGYARLKHSTHLRQIINIRNNLTHSWSCPVVFINNTPHWPLAIRRKRNHPWLYDERDILRQRYRHWLPLLPMLTSDLKFVEGFQNTVFGKLVRDVKNFERNYGVEIR
jgi:hypothetical protein